jgi:hypothetical protein
MSSVTAIRENATVTFVHFQGSDEILTHKQTSQHERMQSKTEITLYIYYMIEGLNLFSSSIDWVNCKEKTYIKYQRSINRSSVCYIYASAVEFLPDDTDKCVSTQKNSV